VPWELAVDSLELSLCLSLAALLVAIAGYFAYRQWQTLRQLRQDRQLSRDDRGYLYRQIVRRIFNSALLLILAGFLVGWAFLEPDMQSLRPADPAAEMPESAKQTLRFITFYWIGALLVFLVVVVLAVSDLLATARFGARRVRQLEDDRRDALKAEVDRLRHDHRQLNGDQ
jgi:hypothetical protein